MPATSLFAKLTSSTARLWLVGLLIASASVVGAQDEPPLVAPTPETPESIESDVDSVGAATDEPLITRLVFDEPPPVGGWLEVAHLAADVEPFVAFFDDTEGLVPDAIDTGLPQGPAMLCAGSHRRATAEPSPTADASEGASEADATEGTSEADSSEPGDSEPDEPDGSEPDDSEADEPASPVVASQAPETTATGIATAIKTEIATEAGVSCRRIFVYRGEASFGAPLNGSLDESVPFSSVATDGAAQGGTPLVGRYRLGITPIDGARVALVPADLGAEQGYVLPLGRADQPPLRLRHAVDTDADGQFRLPPIQAGRYFLEAVLPSGRIHRSEPIDLPDLRSLQLDFGPEPPADLAFDLGTIDVAEGLGLDVTVIDDLGEPVEAARVVARQGDTPASLVTYSARSDADGRVRLSGFDVERPTLLGCSAPGHVPTQLEVELIPVLWTCTLDRLAEVRGVVVGPTDELPAGITLTATSIDETARTTSASPAADGSFRLRLAPGEWNLVAAAPGLLPERLSLFVAAGDRDDLGILVLLPGREIQLSVVDADTGEPVLDATVRAIDPPGAIDTVTDVDGEAQVAVPTDRATTLAVTAEADGYAATSLRIAPGEREPRTVELRRGGWIRVRGCPGCRVRIVPGHHTLATDGDGNALSNALAPGWYDVVRPRFEHLGSTVVETPDAERHRVRVRAGRVATVDFAERPADLVVRPDRRLDGHWRLEARTPWTADRVSPDADGDWNLPHASERRPRDRWLSLHGWDRHANAEIRVFQATLPASFTDDTFPLPIGTGQVRGRLQTGGIGFSGEPAVGVRVRLLRFEDGFLVAEVHSGPDGQFHVPHLHPGTYALHLGNRTYQFLSVGRAQSIDAGTFQLFDQP